MLSSSTPAVDNINAVQAIANVVKSSLGPVGLDKVGRKLQSSHHKVDSMAMDNAQSILLFYRCS